jgi:hypothetical protein
MHRLEYDRTKQLIKKIGAIPSINSGATFSDNDCYLDFSSPLGFRQYKGYSGEVKVTKNKSFPVTKVLLEKTKKEGLSNNRLPFMLIDVQENPYIILSLDDWMDLNERMEFLEKQYKELLSYKVSQDIKEK